MRSGINDIFKDHPVAAIGMLLVSPSRSGPIAAPRDALPEEADQRTRLRERLRRQGQQVQARVGGGMSRLRNRGVAA